MPKKKQPGKSIEKPSPPKHPDIEPVIDPEEPVIPADDPDAIPEDDPFETPPYETPAPGEGP